VDSLNFPHPTSAPSSDSGQSRDRIGEAVGINGRSLEKAKKVVEAARADPELCGDLVEQMDSTGKIDPAYKEMKRRQEEGTKEKPPEPQSLALDFSRLRAYVERIQKRWPGERSAHRVIHFLRQLADEISQTL
jgi:hypothetical protein